MRFPSLKNLTHSNKFLKKSFVFRLGFLWVKKTVESMTLFWAEFLSLFFFRRFNIERYFFFGDLDLRSPKIEATKKVFLGHLFVTASHCSTGHRRFSFFWLFCLLHFCLRLRLQQPQKIGGKNHSHIRGRKWQLFGILSADGLKPGPWVNKTVDIRVFFCDISVLHQHGSSKSKKKITSWTIFLGTRLQNFYIKVLMKRQQEEGSGHAILSEQKELAKVMPEKAVVSEFLDFCPKLHRSGAKSIKHP